jgi:hypothetical protein
MALERFVDLIFQGLDTADAAQEKIRSALGRKKGSDPWVVTWPPPRKNAPRPPAQNDDGDGDLVEKAED